MIDTALCPKREPLALNQKHQLHSTYQFHLHWWLIQQLELLVEDLNHVIRLLNEQHFTESQEKDCRFWLGLQLKIFESFFHFTVGVGRDEKDKVQSHIDKSYEVLDRFFVDSDKGSRSSSQTFYRITESIASLAL